MSLRFRGAIAVFSMLAAAAAGCTEDEAVEGRLQRLAYGGAEKGRELGYLLRLDNGSELELDFDDEAPDLETGTRARIWGRTMDPFRFHVNDWRELEPASSDTELRQLTLVVDPAAPPRPRKIAVVLLNFQNDPKQPVTPADVKQGMFAGAESDKAFFLEQSFGFAILEGKNDVSGDVYGWYTIPMDNTTCTASAFGNAAIAEAQKVGVSITGYDHYVFVWPGMRSCRFGGLGEQPGRRTWINGMSRSVIAHELGHNFNQYHASSLSCGGPDGVRVTLSGTCTSSEYGNPYDIMGSGGMRHTGAYNKARAGWLGPAQIQTVTTSGTYTVLPLEIASTGVQALRAPFDARYNLWVEYRQPSTFDKYLETDAAVTGITMYLAGSSGRPQLLDMNPATTTFRDATLGVGKTFEALGGRTRVTLLSRTRESAQVKFEFAGGSAVAVDGSVVMLVDAGPPPEAREAGVAMPGRDGGAEAGGRADGGAAVDAEGDPGASDAGPPAAPGPKPGSDKPSGTPSMGDSPTPPADSKAASEGGCACAVGARPPARGAGLGAGAIGVGGLLLGLRARRRRGQRR